MIPGIAMRSNADLYGCTNRHPLDMGRAGVNNHVERLDAACDAEKY